METRNSIRKRILAERSGLAEEIKTEYSRRIWQNVISAGLLEHADILLNYADFRGEAETGFYFTYAEEHRIPVFYPKVQGEEMEFYRVRSKEDLTEGYRKIREPDLSRQLPSLSSFAAEGKIHKGCVIIPGSVFSRDGVRYGYGKGFYDRFLPKYPGFVKIGLCYHLQLQEKLEKQEHDVPMDYIVTEKEIIEIGSGTCNRKN